MKKRIFKQQPIKNNFYKDHRKTIYRNRKHGTGKAAMLLIVSLLAGSIQPVHGREADVPASKVEKTEIAGAETVGTEVMEVGGTEAPRVVVTEIFHRHVGSTGVKGGCYQREIPHIHEGNEVDGGACFGKEVKHVHQGDAVSGTGCYTRPILHTHQGSEGNEGACYSAVYHTHENSCYKNEICTIRFNIGDLIESFTEECDTHGEVEFDRRSGTGSHKDCPVGEEELIFEYCPTCGPMSYSYHTYAVVICGVDDQQPIGYEKTCGMEEGDVEGYETGCSLEEGQTESYQRTCERKVDCYDRDCGLDEENPCGRLIVTNETNGKQEKVTISVKFEDLTGGKLVLAQDPFKWCNESGKSIGNGDQIEVEENGHYTVELKLQNRDVDESGLRSRVLVDNVLGKTSDAGQETPSPSASPSSEKGEEVSPSPEQTPSGGNSGVDGQDDKEDTPSPVPSAIPGSVPVLNTDDGNSKEDGAEESSLNGRKAVKASEQDEAEQKETERPSPRIAVKKKTTEKKLKEIMEPAPNLPEPKGVKRIKRFFSIPAVRIVTVAAGTLLLLAGLLLLLLYLRKSVRLYNDDGEGRWKYLGRLMVRLEEEGYAVTISEREEEKSYTNRYCIKPGLFRMGKGGQEIFVYKDNERASVSLAKEMVLVL